MLLQFNVTNFKSFKDKMEFDMTAAAISDAADTVIQIKNEKILPLAAIYGANASGKSNVIEAFRTMKKIVLNSGAFDTEEDQSKKLGLNMPFMFDDDSRSEPVDFEVFCIIPYKESVRTFQYGFSILNGIIQDEWLNSCAPSARGAYRNIFSRDTMIPNGDEKGTPLWRQIKNSFGERKLILSLGAFAGDYHCKLLQNWFKLMDFTDFGNPRENYFLSNQAPSNFINKNVQKRVLTYLSYFDPSIVDFRVEKLPEGEDGQSRLYIGAIHHTPEGKNVEIPLRSESAGTLKMFALYQHLENAFKAGGILFVDELNGKLHPLLVRQLLNSFSDPESNRNHAQLIFTTHDPWTLEHAGLRRDEIWFVEKNKFGQSELYSLSDFKVNNKKIRKDENYETNYMYGRYGAIPDVMPFQFFNGEDNHGKE